MINRVLFKLARNKAFSWVISWMIVNMSFAIPVDRIAETDIFIAFHHPKPSYNLHILLLPKRSYPDLLSIPPSEYQVFTRELLQLVKDLVGQFNMLENGYRLIVNGGPFQEVPHLHFHLVNDHADDSPSD